ncbi:DUF4925 domain-containing protein [Parabacteroides pacaensis]|uniref:DUF4925 domain-containing protein n=1 Tax=Parabacteroides pacaensis TaxID=2086575 RepID=UPI000D0E3544|nr:DUF4925 domain-containing protein [Parabacteroides pacaensis]
MKKNYLRNLLWVVCLAGLFTACDNNDYNGPKSTEVTANYSNKLADGDRATLALTYSGREMIGKSIYFKTENAQKAAMTLLNILPHESETSINNINLIPAEDDKYAFSGNATSDQGTTFKYDGTVTKGKLCVNLTEVKIPDTPMSGILAPVKNSNNTLEKQDTIENKIHRYQLYHQTFYMNTDNQDLGTLELLVGNLVVGPMLNSILKEMNFNVDGNITATYAALPDTFNFQKDILLGGGIVRNNDDWVTSPTNLATYFVANITDLYVTPQIDMIIRQAQSDQAANASTTTKGLLDSVTDSYAQIKKWATTGIRLNIKENPKKEYYVASESSRYVTHRKYEGDYILYLDKQEIEVFIPVIKMLVPILLTPEIIEQINQATGGFLDVATLLNTLIKSIEEAKTLEIGLYLNKMQ